MRGLLEEGAAFQHLLAAVCWTAAGRAPPPQGRGRPQAPSQPGTGGPPPRGRPARPPQVWRLLTCHVFMAFGMSFVFNMLFLIKYGGNLESEVFRFNPAGAGALRWGPRAACCARTGGQRSSVPRREAPGPNAQWPRQRRAAISSGPRPRRRRGRLKSSTLARAAALQPTTTATQL
jgi:hypothetical protein